MFEVGGYVCICDWFCHAVVVLSRGRRQGFGDFGSPHCALISAELRLAGIIYVDLSSYALQIFLHRAEILSAAPCHESLSLSYFIITQIPSHLFLLGLRLRAVGVEEQQYKQRGAGAGSTDQSGCSSGRLLEVFTSPAPATLSQVQHLPGQGRAVWGLHAEGPASFTRSGERITTSSFKEAVSIILISSRFI